MFVEHPSIFEPPPALHVSASFPFLKADVFVYIYLRITNHCCTVTIHLSKELYIRTATLLTVILSPIIWVAQASQTCYLCIPKSLHVKPLTQMHESCILLLTFVFNVSGFIISTRTTYYSPLSSSPVLLSPSPLPLLPLPSPLSPSHSLSPLYSCLPTPPLSLPRPMAHQVFPSHTM